MTTTATAAVHPVDQKLPWGRTLVYAFQHVLAMYAGAVAVPLVLAGAVHLSTEELIYLINADLFTCGIATLVQSLSIRDYIGSKLPIVQGCTFTAVTPMIIIANTHGGGATGLQVVYGAAIFAGIACFVISNFFSKMLRFFPPVVTGSVITVIGLSLMPVAVNWIAGANPTAPDYCDPTHILMAALVLAIILVIYRVCRGFLRQISVLLGLVIGTLIADALGMADFHAVGEAASLGITTPFAFGYPIFEPVSCLAMTLVMLVTMAETTGDIVAISEIVDKPMTEDMLTKALRADGPWRYLQHVPVHGLCAEHRPHRHDGRAQPLHRRDLRRHAHDSRPVPENGGRRRECADHGPRRCWPCHVRHGRRERLSGSFEGKPA